MISPLELSWFCGEPSGFSQGQPLWSPDVAGRVLGKVAGERGPRVDTEVDPYNVAGRGAVL